MDYANTESILAELQAPAAEPEAAAPSADAQPTAPEASAQSERFLEVPWNGKAIKAQESDVIKWASQGYDYSQKMNQFNQERAERDAHYQSLEGRLKPFQEIDDFARKNPEWWSHVEKGFQERDQILQQNLVQKVPEEMRPVIESLLNENREVKQFVSDWHKEKLELQAKEDDQRLSSTIQSLQQQHKIDFGSRDQSGQTLEFRVIAHAREMGLPDKPDSFRIAFNDYYQPQWAKHYEMQGREAERRELAKQREQGLLGRVPAPSAQQDLPLRPARNMEEAHQFALRELGIN